MLAGVPRIGAKKIGCWDQTKGLMVMDENDKTRIDETTVMTPPEQRGDGDKDARRP